MKQKLWPIVELESAQARIERYLSVSDKRPNFIKRNLYNALNWNAIAVLDKPKSDEEIIERSWHFTDGHIHVDPKLDFLTKLNFYVRPDISLGEKLRHIRMGSESSKKWIVGMNEVTNDGEIGYANQAAEEAPAANEDFFVTALSNEQLANPAVQNSILATDTWTQFDNPGAAAIAGSNKNFDVAFPKRNDGDADNTGAGVDIVSFLTSYTTGDFNDGGVTIKNFSINDQNSPVGATKLLTHGQITAFNKTATDTLKFFINHEMRRV